MPLAESVLGSLQCFETEALMGQAGVVAPVLTYLFHRLEERFTGGPRCSSSMRPGSFSTIRCLPRIREWLKTLRKKNVAVLFATQSLADIADSPIAPAIIESCPQRILLPNDRAIEPQSRAIYERFGLNDRQIELISRASPKRHYYLQSARGNRLFELGLGRRAGPVRCLRCRDPGPHRCAARPLRHGPLRRPLSGRRRARLGRALLHRFPRSASARPGRATMITPRLQSRRLHAIRAGSMIAAALALVTVGTPARAQWTVFDPTNYSQNILTAARTLQQINNQITMLQNQAKHLLTIGFPELTAISQTLSSINQLMSQAQALEFKVATIDQQFKTMFPTTFNQALTNSQHVTEAQTRLSTAKTAFEQTMTVQAQIVETIAADTATLSSISGRSQSAQGSLQAQQATNQLLALIAKQQMQLQTMMAAQDRAEALDRMNRVQSRPMRKAPSANSSAPAPPTPPESGCRWALDACGKHPSPRLLRKVRSRA
jgi:P-type conjugative transfer protein TrbJ